MQGEEAADMLTLSSTRVWSDKESQDGYEASNLQGAAGSVTRARGFMSASFVLSPLFLLLLSLPGTQTVPSPSVSLLGSVASHLCAFMLTCDVRMTHNVDRLIS